MWAYGTAATLPALCFPATMLTLLMWACGSATAFIALRLPALMCAYGRAATLLAICPPPLMTAHFRPPAIIALRIPATMLAQPMRERISLFMFCRNAALRASISRLAMITLIPREQHGRALRASMSRHAMRTLIPREQLVPMCTERIHGRIRI